MPTMHTIERPYGDYYRAINRATLKAIYYKVVIYVRHRLWLYPYRYAFSSATLTK